jgi:aspartate-semialdehyde dehydrogenase
VSVEFVAKPTLEQVRRALAEFRGEPQTLQLPTAPQHPIVVRDEPDRPQPGLDRDAEAGMASVIGRLRACSALDCKFTLLGHNTIRGAAGGTLLNAELLMAKGFVQ